MAAIHLKYLGDLRTEATHLASGSTCINDAPADNQGKGESFSPTDAVCTALASCMLITMGIVAERDGVDLRPLRADVVKVMSSSPRRIGEIRVRLFTEGILNLTEEQRQKLQRAAHRCPVALSLHPDIVQNVAFEF